MLQHIFSVTSGSKPLFHRQLEKWKTNNEEIGMTKMEMGNKGIKILRVGCNITDDARKSVGIEKLFALQNHIAELTVLTHRSSSSVMRSIISRDLFGFRFFLCLPWSTTDRSSDLLRNVCLSLRKETD